MSLTDNDIGRVFEISHDARHRDSERVSSLELGAWMAVFVCARCSFRRDIAGTPLHIRRHPIGS